MKHETLNIKHETWNYDSILEYKEKRRFSMSNTSFLRQRYDEVKWEAGIDSKDKKVNKKNGPKNGPLTNLIVWVN